MPRVLRLTFVVVAAAMAAQVLPRPPAPAIASGPEEWQHLSPAPPSPTGRQHASLTYDPVGRRVILFGGRDRLGGKNDVWTLTAQSDSSLRWSLLEPEGEPPATRSDHVAAFDAAGNRLVVFGGMDGATQRLLNDTWFLEFGGARPRWVRAAAIGTAPPVRYASGAIYDPRSKRFVLFGGRNQTSADYRDTWSLDLAADQPAWREMTPGGELPEPRDAFLAAYDGVRHRMVVFAGMLRWRETQLGDLHYLDLTPGGERWSTTTVTGEGPVTREDAVGDFDPITGRLVVFGGWNRVNQALDDVWSFDSEAPGWRRLDPSGGGPGARAGMAAVFDPATGRLITCCGFLGQVPVADVWGLKVSVPPSPTPIRATPTPTGSTTPGGTGGTPKSPEPSLTPTSTASATRLAWRLHLPRLFKDPRPTATSTPSTTPTATPVPCGLDEVEPNDLRAQALASPPLCEGRNGEGRITYGDLHDLWWLEVSKPSTLDVLLYNPPGVDFDLYIYDEHSTTVPIGRSRAIGPGSERVVVDVAPGRYFLRVWPVEGVSDVPYLVRWTAY